MYFLTSVILGVRILICLCVFEGCLQVLICSHEKAWVRDDSLTHFFIDALDDSITYPSESGELTNARPTPECRLKDRIALFPLECLNGTDIRIRA